MKRQRGLVLLLALAGLAAGCTGSGSSVPVTHPTASAKPTAAPAPARAELDAFRGCGDALASLRRATAASVTAYGLPGSAGAVSFGAEKSAAGGVASAPVPAAAAAGTAGGGGAQAAYSGTNTAEPGVDEPDLVKTDGRRIVTIEGGVLTVVDAASRRVTGTLRLPAGGVQRPGGIAAKTAYLPFGSLPSRDRKSTRLNSSHSLPSRMPSSA